MFTSRRALRTIITATRRQRPPSRMLGYTSQQVGHGEQRVEIKKSRSLTYVLINIGLLFACTSIYEEVVLAPLFRAEEESVKDLPMELQMEGDYTPLFLPFLGTTKALERRPYDPDDPDWIEMTKFAKDEKAKKQALESVTRTVHNTIAESGALGPKLTVTHAWFYFDYVRKVPPEFQRSGLEFSNGFIKWATRPVDADKVYQSRSIFLPWPLMHAIRRFASVWATDEYDRLARMVGLRKADHSPGPERSFASQHAVIKKIISEAEKDGHTGSKPSVLVNSRMVQDKAPVVQSPQSDSQKPQQEQHTKQGATASGASSDRVTTEKPRAVQEAVAKMRETQLRHPPPLPKGCVVIGGWVEVASPSGAMIIEVSAPFNARTKEFETSNLRLYSRRTVIRTTASGNRPNGTK